MSTSPNDPTMLLTQLRGIRSVLDEVGAYVFTKDLDGRYTYANHLVLGLFGCSLDAVIGKDDSHFFDLASSGELRENDRLVLEQGQIIEREELNFIKPSGEPRYFWTVKKPLCDDSGQIVGMCGISTDITERKRLEREIARQQQLLETVLANVDAYIYVRDEEHRYQYVNRKVEELFGRPQTEIIGKTDAELNSATATNDFMALDDQVFSTGQRQAAHEKFVDQQGLTRHCWSVKVPMDTGIGRPTLIGFSSDITELYTLQKEMERLAGTDALTNLANRRTYNKAVEREFSRAVRHSLPLSMLMLDIDHFKAINDQHGHPAGDRILADLAERIRSCLRLEDLPARIGGEEFAVLLPETDSDAALFLAERIRQSVGGSPFFIDEFTSASVTVSIGATSLNRADENLGELYSRADRSLYQAKRTGRDRVCSVMVN